MYCVGLKRHVEATVDEVKHLQTSKGSKYQIKGHFMEGGKNTTALPCAANPCMNNSPAKVWVLNPSLINYPTKLLKNTKKRERVPKKPKRLEMLPQPRLEWQSMEREWQESQSRYGC